MTLSRFFFWLNRNLTRRAASHLGQRSQTVRKARRSLKRWQHINALRADIDAQLAEKGKPPAEYKHEDKFLATFEGAR